MGMTTPIKVASAGTEAAHQKAFMVWCALAAKYGWQSADIFAEHEGYRAGYNKMKQVIAETDYESKPDP